MAITTEQYKNLQRYLDDEMTKEQEADFEKELATDAGLKEHYSFEVGLRNYLDLSELKKAIPGFSARDLTIDEPAVISLPVAKERTNAAKSGGSKKWMYYAAACIAIVTGSIFLLYHHGYTTQTTTQEEARKNDTGTVKPGNQSPLQEASNNKADSDNRKKEKEEKNDNAPALLALAQQYFLKDTIPDESADTFASHLPDLAKNDRPATDDPHLPMQHNVDGYAGARPDNKDAVPESKKIDYYNKGINFIELKRYRQAEEKLQWVIDNSSDENYIGNARWYLALAYLMEGNKAAALPLLSEVATDTAAIPYNGQARSLLNELKKE